MPDEKWFGPLELTARERAGFLKSERWAVFGTLTESGAPVGVPLGFVVDGDDFDESTPVYIAVRGDDPLLGRVRAGSEICMAVDNHQFPTKAVIASGRAAVVKDPDPEIVRRLARATWPPAAGLDGDEALDRWLATGQAVIKIAFDDIVSWDSTKVPGYADAPAVHAKSIQRDTSA